MTVREMIKELTKLAELDLKGGDAEVVLFNRETGLELRVDPDADRFEFELLRGDGQLVIEF